MLARLAAYVRGLARRRQIAREVDEELRFHVEQEIAGHVARGLSLIEARRLALRDLGGLRQTTDAVRDVRTTCLDLVGRELRHAVRALTKSRMAVAVSSVVLGLAIGLAATIFAVTDATFYKPLPGVARSADLVSLYTDQRDTVAVEYGGVSYPDFKELESLENVFAGLASYVRLPLWMRSGAIHKKVVAEFVTGRYFDVLGTAPALGRLIRAEDERSGAFPVAVLGHALWRDGFAGATDVVGRTVTVSFGESTRIAQIVGVAPPDFHGPLLDWYGDQQLGVFVPFRTYDDLLGGRAKVPPTANRRFASAMVVGRLRQSDTLGAAQRAVSAKAKRLGDDYPDTNRNRLVMVLPSAEARFWPGRYESSRRLLSVLGLISLLLLLVAFANVANLTATRTLAARHAIAVQLAMGARVRHLVHAHLIEIAAVAVGAVFVGRLVAEAGVAVLGSYSSLFGVPLHQELRVEGRTVSAIVALGIMAAGVCLFLPAAGVWRDIGRNLGTATMGALGRASSQTHARQMLVVLQVAMSVVAVTVASLLGMSILALSQVDVGYDASRVGVVPFELDASIVGAMQDGRSVPVEALLERTRRIPGVEAVAVSQEPPLSSLRPVKVLTESGQPDGLAVVWREIGRGYFDSLGVSMLRGREFQSEGVNEQSSVIVNQVLANRMWSGGVEAVGQSVQIRGENHRRLVIGVAPVLRHQNVTEEGEPYIYLPITPATVASGAVINFRTRSSAASVVAPLSQTLTTPPPAIAVGTIRTMDDILKESAARQRVSSLMAVLAALAAVVLACVGVFALVSSLVQGNRREIAIRMACGGTRGVIIADRLRWIVKLAGLGAVGGLLLWLPLRSLVEAELYQPVVSDLVVVALAVATMVALSCAAALWPLWLVTRLMPRTLLGDA